MTSQHDNASRTNYEVAAGELLSSLIDLYPNFKLEDPSHTKGIWAAHLQEFTPEAIKKAAAIMTDEHPTFAPTLGEFKLLCKRYSVSRRPEHQMHKPLPMLKSDSKTGRAALDKIHALLGRTKLRVVP